MGIICELYRMSDADIEELTRVDPGIAEKFINDNYGNVYGKFHKQNDTVFSLDKGWDVTKFLLKKADFSADKILNELDKKYINSSNVKRMNNVIKQLKIENLLDLCDPIELIKNNVYRAEIGKNKENIEYHLNIYKSGFNRASEMNDGIVINFD